jgi:hypothetical protein
MPCTEIYWLLWKMTERWGRPTDEVANAVSQRLSANFPLAGHRYGRTTYGDPTEVGLKKSGARSCARLAAKKSLRNWCAGTIRSIGILIPREKSVESQGELMLR